MSSTRPASSRENPTPVKEQSPPSPQSAPAAISTRQMKQFQKKLPVIDTLFRSGISVELEPATPIHKATLIPQTHPDMCLIQTSVYVRGRRYKVELVVAKDKSIESDQEKQKQFEEAKIKTLNVALKNLEEQLKAKENRGKIELGKGFQIEFTEEGYYAWQTNREKGPRQEDTLAHENVDSNQLVKVVTLEAEEISKTLQAITLEKTNQLLLSILGPQKKVSSTTHDALGQKAIGLQHQPPTTEEDDKDASQQVSQTPKKTSRLGRKTTNIPPLEFSSPPAQIHTFPSTPKGAPSTTSPLPSDSSRSAPSSPAD